MGKQRNVGTLERWLRVLGGGIVVIVGLIVLLPSPASIGTGVLAVALIVLGADVVFTGLTGYCPLYHRLGWSTARHHEAAPRQMAARPTSRTEA